MLEELKFSIGGMEGWTKVTVKIEDDIVHYAVDSLMGGITSEKKLRKVVSKIFLQKIEGLQINRWKSKYQPPEEIMDILYPFINADSIQNAFVEFNMLNSEHTEKINIT